MRAGILQEIVLLSGGTTFRVRLCTWMLPQAICSARADGGKAGTRRACWAGNSLATYTVSVHWSGQSISIDELLISWTSQWNCDKDIMTNEVVDHLAEIESVAKGRLRGHAYCSWMMIQDSYALYFSWILTIYIFSSFRSPANPFQVSIYGVLNLYHNFVWHRSDRFIRIRKKECKLLLFCVRVNR